MMRVCHLGTCPVGIATQDPELRKKFAGKPEHVINYFFFVASEVRAWMAEHGFKNLDDVIGQTQYLDTNKAIRFWKARGIDLTQILHGEGDEIADPTSPVRCFEAQDHGLDGALDHQLITKARAALENQTPVEFSLPIKNNNRTCGTMLSGKVAKNFGAAGLPDATIKIDFTGSAGQSFGAFLAPGMQLTLVGDANDYLGKGMSGGRIIVCPPKNTAFAKPASENTIAGNTLLYGATGGEAYLAGAVGERFCVRNSGAVAVVEGVGDHCCEYMTGGVTVVIGRTGRNFAAGMSGGVAFVYDLKDGFPKRVNKDIAAGVSLVTGNDIALICALFPESLPPILTNSEPTDDAGVLRALIAEHVRRTGSVRAASMLENWELEKLKFVKIISPEYQKLLHVRKLK
jgi:glutamate synthase (NADPH) large chain